MIRMSNRLIPSVIIFSIFMCFLGKTASAQIENYDETYYSPAKNEVVVEKYDPIVLYKDTTVRSVEQELILELEGVPMNAETKAKTVVVYDESDYYDYAYTARIRRFDNPVIGVGYYDDYYTNMYWYTYNPNYWGVSIYLGYNWWYPSWSWYYRPYYYSYWGYYDPFFNPYWNPYWDPFYYGHHHHHHHHYGHHHGHHHYGHHHHYAWNCNHYYNSLDRGSFYYGPRTYNGATTRYLGGRTENIAYRNSTARYSNRDNRSFGQRYESAIASRTNTSRGNNTAGLNTPTRRGGVDINRNAYRSSTSERTSSATTGRVTTGTTDRGTTTTGRVTTGTTDRTSTTGTTRQVSGSDKYSKPSSVENTRNEQYTRPTTRTSTSSDRVSGSSNNNSNNRSSYSGSSNSKTRSSNTTGTIQRRSSNNSGSINRSSSTNSRSSSVRSSGSSSRNSSSYGSSSRSSSSSSRSSSSGSSRSSRR